jgi:hypothetical protein
MSEKLFQNQNNYGWGLTFNMTGKVPAINKRIFNTLADALEFANDYDDSAIEGLILSVVADENEKNNGSYFVSKVKRNADEEAVLQKIGSVELAEAKSSIDEYTVNDKKISESPVLDTTDLKVNENYTSINQQFENVVPGDILTTAISKIEVMLANTTLALTAAISDLDKRIGVPTEYDDDGNIVREGTGLYRKYEEIYEIINNIN